MNNTRRKAIKEVMKKIENLEGLLIEIKEELEFIRDEEEEYMNNIPENLQTSERYEKAEAATDNLYAAVDELEEFDFEQLLTYLEESME